MSEFSGAIAGHGTPHAFRTRAWAAAVAGLALLTLLMYGDVVLLPGDVILSDSQTDVALYYAYFQQFGYEELRQGNLPLWNPYLFSGQPYVGSFDTAMLYPLNLVFLVLPLAKAINVDFALHTFLAGVFMLVWTARRGVHPLACFTAGALLMFCGPFASHIYGGHPTIVRAMAWAPLILAAIDASFARPSLGWTLVGAAAFAMELLTGNMQYVFYTGLACGLYCVLRFWRADRRLHIVAALAGIVAGGIGLSAVQLFTGLDAASESVRSGRVPYAFAAMFSFPPENLLTFVVPGFFGDMIYCKYWGRCYLWEMQAYFGVTGLALAVYGAVWGRPEHRRFSLPLALVLLVLALGSHTPLFRLLYNFMPGFDNFRGNSKFIFQAMLFLIMLSAAGLDAVIARTGDTKRVATILAIAAVVVAAIGVMVYMLALRDADAWRSLAIGINAQTDSYQLKPSDVTQVGRFAGVSTVIAAAALALSAICFAVLRTKPRAVVLVVALAIVDVGVFASNMRASFPLSRLREVSIEQFYAKALPDDSDVRVLQLYNPNHAMLARVHEMWGHDSFVLRRYAEFMSHTQGIPPERATSYVAFERYHPWYKLIRTKYVIYLDERGVHATTVEPVLERFHLVHDYRVISDRDALFQAMESPAFNPLERVLLERAPAVRPEPPSQPGRVTLIEEGTDHVVVDVESPQRAILLMTDAYSAGWRATAVTSGVQAEYEVLPANYILRAIPLERGMHRIRIEYAPRAFRAGLWVSVVSLGVFGVLLVVWGVRRRSRRFQPAALDTGGAPA